MRPQAREGGPTAMRVFRDRYSLVDLKVADRSDFGGAMEATLFSLSGNVAELVRMDIQADIGHVIKVLAGGKPDDLANFAF